MDLKIFIIAYATIFLLMISLVCCLISLVKLKNEKETLKLKREILEHKKELLDIITEMINTYSAVMTYLLNKTKGDEDAKI